MLAARRWWLGTIALIVALAMPASQVVLSAVVRGVIECCCGPHDADHACGCPDCPAGNAGSAPMDTGTPSFKPCGVDGAIVTATLFPDMATAPGMMMPVAPAGPGQRAISDTLPHGPPADVATPPPRARG